ncbi:hypothetical protein [Paenibacillus glucanolyticus]|uniref:hypothetical protein n=1 Tax=Paenibacillus glucanolyticus TaxID=59843 RepID=UPI00096F0209|nr:hypothetical protein [Paenibacillus glucanolyticus]OMF76798.1 hypothetical protein BK142_14870 [Paenibacillus glucanolyticus]
MTTNNNVNEIQQSNTVYNLEFFKTAQYWNNEHGAGVKNDGSHDFRHWMVDVDGYNGRIPENPDKPFAEQLAEYLADNLGYKQDYLAIMDDGRLSFNIIENADGEPVPNGGEDMGTQLYLCDYDCHIKVTYEFTPNRERLAELLPNAEH